MFHPHRSRLLAPSPASTFTCCPISLRTTDSWRLASNLDTTSSAAERGGVHSRGRSSRRRGAAAASEDEMTSTECCGVKKQKLSGLAYSSSASTTKLHLQNIKIKVQHCKLKFLFTVCRSDFAIFCLSYQSATFESISATF